MECVEQEITLIDSFDCGICEGLNALVGLNSSYIFKKYFFIICMWGFVGIV